MTIGDAVSLIGSSLPIELMADKDNVGLIAGNYDDECGRISVTYELNREVINEAVRNQVDLLVTYHTPIYRAVKSLTTSISHPNSLLEAVRSKLSVFAIHTALDVVKGGLNFDLAERLNLKRLRFLSPLRDTLFKVVVFVPESHAELVRQEMSAAGAGRIGNYSNCSFSVDGGGTFLAGEATSPFVGEMGKLEFVNETRIEFVVEKHLLNAVLNAMLDAHPYEEVAYDIYQVGNLSSNLGFGVVGELEKPEGIREFLTRLKNRLQLDFVKLSRFPNDKVTTIALCAGAGYAYYSDAVKARADVFITGDIKHHDFREAQLHSTVLVDATHQGTERFVQELMHRLIGKIFEGKAEVESSEQRLENALVF